MKLCPVLTFLAVSLISNWRCALGKDKPFPTEILSSKTIAVVAHYGLVPSALNPAKGDQFRASAEDVLRQAGRFTVLEDPDQADLVLLLVGGYSPGLLGFRDHIGIGAVFLGGAQPRRSPLPQWILEQVSTFRTTAPAALTKEFLKQVAKAELHGAPPPAGSDNEKSPPEATPSDHPTHPDNEKEENAPPTENPDPQWLRPEILQAKKVMVLLRADEVAGSQGEDHEKSVEKELKKWGRFSIVNNPADADLVFVCILYLDSSRTQFQVFENLLIFKGGTHNPDWSAAPLWTAMQIQALFGPLPGT